MDRQEIFDGVRDSLTEVLMLKDPDKIRIQSSLVEELGADSLDFLDMLYHLEERFSIRISKDEINYYSNLGLSEAETHQDGVLTPAALEKLRQMMPEVDHSRLTQGLTVSEVPKLLTVETLMNIVARKLEGTASGAA